MIICWTEAMRTDFAKNLLTETNSNKKLVTGY